MTETEIVDKGNTKYVFFKKRACESLTYFVLSCKNANLPQRLQKNHILENFNKIDKTVQDLFFFFGFVEICRTLNIILSDESSASYSLNNR